MARTHCICPEFISKNISDPYVFTNFFMGNLLTSQDQVVFDSYGKLVIEYTDSVKSDENSYTSLKAWIHLLEQKEKIGKLLVVECKKNTDKYDLVFQTIKSAPTTFDKCIIASNNNNYCTYIDEMKKQKISLINLNCLSTEENGLVRKKLSFEELSVDIAWMLHRIARTNSKGTSEDDINDHLRNLLLARKYETKDQTREGISSSGKSAGELDIIIEDNNSIFTIIEAMKLTDLDKSYIKTHYQKLLVNYNPLGIQKSFLITYYKGSNFSSWWTKYHSYISDIEIDNFGFDGPVNIIETVDNETPYSALKKLTQHICVDGEIRTCVHYAIQI